MSTTPEALRSVNVGDVIVYNDGRPGHCDITATVLHVGASCLTVLFADRADTSHIKYTEPAWLKFLSCPPKTQIHGEQKS